MSAGLLQRLESILDPIWHHHNPHYRKEVIMGALSRLSAAVGDLTAENADLKQHNEQLEQENAELKAHPAGTSDQDLDGITSQIEAALGYQVADPDTSTGQTGSQDTGQSASAQPVVGDTSTTVTGQDGSTTTLDHVSQTVSTTDASGATVPADQAAAQAVTQAARDAGKIA